MIRISRFSLVTTILFACFSFRLHAGVKLASYFGDHMVLQRERPVYVWGTGTPGTPVIVILNRQTVTATVDASGNWECHLKPMRAGGPYLLTAISGGTTNQINDVLCGDVWLCSGQSNMQMPVKECVETERNEINTPHPRLRFGIVGPGWNDKPQASANIQWRDYSRDAALDFSAVGCFFATELLKDPAIKNIPVGVINASVGGTMCEGWIPQSALAAFRPDELHDSMFGIKPAQLYNGMIAPLGHAAFRGVIWYQGEGNSGHPDTYPRLLSTLISEWRGQFNDPRLPFYIVQLPDYASTWDGLSWAWEREAQAKVARSTSDTTLVVAINTTDGFDLHPKNKLLIGRRVALAVRHNDYHENIAGSGPVFKTAEPNGQSIRVKFDTGEGGLSNSTPDPLRGFAVAGADGVYYFADATIDSDNVIVQSPAVPAPQTVRYAWAGVPDSTLVNQSGLPAAPFRTDDFPASKVEFQKQSISRQIATPAYQTIINGDGMMSSFVAGNEQFLSNDPGMAGGCNIAGLFGPIGLPEIHELGPTMLSCKNGSLDLLMTFADKTIQWNFTNHSKDPAQFQIALSPQVTVSKTNAENLVQLQRHQSSLSITGIDSVTDTADAKQLHIVILGNATKTVTFEIR